MTAAAPVFTELPLWKVVIKLLRLRVMIYISGFKRAKKAKKFWMITGWVAILLVFLLAIGGTALVMKLFQSPGFAQAAGDFSPLIEGIPSLLIAGTFLMILLTSFGVLLQALYLAGDMDFLLTSPVSIRAVFVSKLLLAILPNFTLMSLFSLPILFGIGISSGYNILYFPLVIIILFLLSLSAAGISSLLVMAIVRVVPAKRVAEILAFFGAIISMTCSQWGNLSRNVDYSGTPQMLTGRMGAIERMLGPYSPLAWAGRGLVDLGSGHWLTGILFTTITLVLSAGIFWVALTASERLYYSGWASIQAVPKKARPARQANASTRTASQPNRISRFIPPQVRAIMYKDFLMLRRDLRSMSQVVTPLIFGIIYGFILLRNGGEVNPGAGEPPEAFMSFLETAFSYGSVGLSVFIAWSLLSRLALMSFSSEGMSYWLLKSAPVRTRSLLLAKFAVALIPSIALSWIFLLGMTLLQKQPFSVAWYGFAVVALVNAGLTGISLAFGVTGAKLDWTDPRRMSSGGWSGCISGLVSFGFIFAILSIFIAPLAVLPLLDLPVALGQVIGLLIGGIICLACMIAPPLLVRKRVELIGEGVL